MTTPPPAPSPTSVFPDETGQMQIKIAALIDYSRSINLQNTQLEKENCSLRKKIHEKDEEVSAMKKEIWENKEEISSIKEQLSTAKERERFLLEQIRRLEDGKPKDALIIVIHNLKEGERTHTVEPFYTVRSLKKAMFETFGYHHADIELEYNGMELDDSVTFGDYVQHYGLKSGDTVEAEFAF